MEISLVSSYGSLNLFVPRLIISGSGCRLGQTLRLSEKKRKIPTSKLPFFYRKHHDDRPMAFWGVSLYNFQTNTH
jgi:hypothetical protein